MGRLFRAATRQNTSCKNSKFKTEILFRAVVAYSTFKVTRSYCQCLYSPVTCTGILDLETVDLGKSTFIQTGCVSPGSVNECFTR